MSVPPEPTATTFAAEYATALGEYLSGAGEPALTRAYELGRAAVSGGLGVVDMVALYEEALRNVVAAPAVQAAHFLAENLSPFELTHRGYQDANARLQQLNQDLRQKNRELEETARELKKAKEAAERANEDLEAFSYSVSHDLRAPLRAIAGFAQALLEDFSEALDPRGRGYLDRVIAGAHKMGLLIDDLLAFSRVSRSELRRETVDLSQVAREVVAELRAREPERAVETVIADGLVARADRRLMAIVLDNLLGNAWKFTAHAADPRIEFSSAESPTSGRVYVVRDNGAGFDQAFAPRLFAPFQRLHSERDFPGTGIGLATVHRIVTRHGGQVWAEGSVDRGAAFHFTLPGDQG